MCKYKLQVYIEIPSQHCTFLCIVKVKILFILEFWNLHLPLAYLLVRIRQALKYFLIYKNNTIQKCWLKRKHFSPSGSLSCECSSTFRPKNHIIPSSPATVLQSGLTGTVWQAEAAIFKYKLTESAILKNKAWSSHFWVLPSELLEKMDDVCYWTSAHTRPYTVTAVQDAWWLGAC